jgi:Xaa-Pro dipeptidase
MSVYETRRNAVCGRLAESGTAMVMLEDFEGRRDPAVRWLSGQPGDALLFLSASKQSLLVPWDINMAIIYADADAKIPYNDFERSPLKALKKAADFFKLPRGSRIEIPPVTAYPRFLRFVEEMGQYFDILCREDGAAGEIERLRAVKDADEISIYGKAADITNELIDALEKQARRGKLKTETDAALFIEAECRRRGCEGTGFGTLAAGPGRSYGIHAFPGYTGEPFAAPGLSILDFGVKYAGYTTDVTLTFAAEPLSKAQEKMLALVEKAYGLALSLAKKGAVARSVARAVDAFFAKAGKAMPHGLGHGIGLEAHEAPFIRGGSGAEWTLEPGMVITLEPGLYDPAAGGCRLENDILITESGPKPLTRSRIVRL